MEEFGGSSSNSSNSSGSSNININECPVHVQPVFIGGRGQVTPGLANRIRSGAGTSYRELGMAQPGVIFDVLDGPVCSDGLWWWQINYQGTTGWTVEGDNDDNWIERVSGNSTPSSQPYPSPGPNREPIAREVIDSWDADYQSAESRLQELGVNIAETGDNTAMLLRAVDGSANLQDIVCFIGGQTNNTVDFVCVAIGYAGGPYSPAFYFSAAKSLAWLNQNVDSWLQNFYDNSTLKPSCIYGHLTNNQDLLQYCN